MAEEGVIRLLLLDGALAEKCRDLAPESFSSPFLGRIYSLLLEAWEEGRTMSAASLAGECGPEEMSHLTGILQKPEAPARADRALADYIQVIQASAAKRLGLTEADPLQAAVEKFKGDKKKKGNGGKQS